MSTELTDFHRFLRVLIGDMDDDIPEFSSDRLTDALGLAVATGKVIQASDGVTPYELESGNETITPELTSSSDIVAYTKLIFSAAKILIGPMTRNSFSIRAYSQSVGAPEELVMAIYDEIYQLDNSDGCN